MIIEVHMLSGRGIECDLATRAGDRSRTKLAFSQLADTIDIAFERWELSHAHEFERPHGGRIRFPDVRAEERSWQDHNALRVLLRPNGLTRHLGRFARSPSLVRATYQLGVAREIERPTLIPGNAIAQAFPPVPVAIEVTMLELDPRPPRRLCDEADLDLARPVEIRL